MSFTPPIGPNEIIKFVATYDRETAFVQKIPGYPETNLGQFLKISGLGGNSFISVNSISSSTGVPGAPSIADETYSIVSYNSFPIPQKLGSLIWSGIYIDQLSIDGKTPPSIEEFAVTGASGIFSEVNRVIVDYNNIIRVCYFIGSKTL
jgi:hypothetical protein